MAVDRLDITDKVEFGLNDGEALPLTQCICGKTWGLWDFILWGSAMRRQCPQCGRWMWFSIGITVYQEAPPEAVLQGDDYTERPEEAGIAKAKVE